jgi:hypothetical protein
MVFHETLANGRWNTFSLAEQMGNIGSEVHRSIIAFQKKDMVRFTNAFDRALELFDLTLADPKLQGRRWEIGRAREVFCSLFYDPEPYSTPEGLDKYFMEFAVAARLAR